mgnify:FL=1
MKITTKDVEQVALLSRLEIPADQQEDFTGRLNAILDYMEMLNSLDTTGIEPTAHVLPLKNVMRADETQPSLARDLALSNAPEQEDGYFRVPKIMEG